MHTKELEALLRLINVPGVGPARVRALVSHFRTASAVLSASTPALYQVPGIDRTLAENIQQNDSTEFAQTQLARLAQSQLRLMTFWDADYPLLLKRTHDPPILLYLDGAMQPSDQRALAVVGTRTPTQYGKLVTERVTQELVQRGLSIVSGLARGVDTIAHRTALKSGGRTIAVLGSGLDVIYPSENQALARQIAQNGVVLSEFPFGAKPDAVNFPRRNRIISGLAWGVVVVEAGEVSGAMITANIALEQNREVFAVPGSIFSPKSIGPHRLLREGAKLVQSVDDILEELVAQLDLFSPAPAESPQPPDLDEKSKTVYDLLSHEPCHIDELTRNLEMSASELMAILLDLELNNLIRQLPGKFFIRISIRVKG